MTKITFKQYEIMNHTLGWGGNRNWFGTDDKGRDAQEFYKLIKMGLATSRPAQSWSGDDINFFITDEGKALLESQTSKQKVKMLFDYITYSPHPSGGKEKVRGVALYLRISYSKAHHALQAMVKDDILQRNGNFYKLSDTDLEGLA